MSSCERSLWQLDCDVEWKFARTKLWLNYMDNDTALPIPFNLLPTWGSVRNACRFLCKWLSREHGLLFDRPRSYTFIKARVASPSLASLSHTHINSRNALRVAGPAAPRSTALVITAIA